MPLNESASWPYRNLAHSMPQAVLISGTVQIRNRGASSTRPIPLSNQNPPSSPSQKKFNQKTIALLLYLLSSNFRVVNGEVDLQHKFENLE